MILGYMAVNKAPGSDGLPVEFYVSFWGDIGPLVVDSFDMLSTKVIHQMNKAELLYL